MKYLSVNLKGFLNKQTKKVRCLFAPLSWRLLVAPWQHCLSVTTSTWTTACKKDNRNENTLTNNKTASSSARSWNVLVWNVNFFLCFFQILVWRESCETRVGGYFCGEICIMCIEAFLTRIGESDTAYVYGAFQWRIGSKFALIAGLSKL